MTEFDALLSPIRVDEPTGDDLRLSASDLTLRRVQDLRTELEPAFDPAGTGRVADWNAAARECESALRTRSKDLEIAVWLAEAWTRIQGFRGLRDGLRLVAQLCDRFWDRLHPGLDAGQIELPIRVKPLNWLGGSRGFLRAVDVCEFAAAGDAGPRLSWELYQLSQRVDEKAVLTDQKPYIEMIQRGLIGGEAWRARLRAVDSGALAELHGNVMECQAALEELLRVLEKQLGDEAGLIHLVPLAERLGEIREHLEGHVKPRASGGAALQGASNGEARHMEATVSRSAESAARASVSVPQGGIETREQALRLLADVAAYFQRNEPHSPLPALILRAVRWGSMPFEQMLPELVTDPNALTRAWDTLGIRPDRK